MLSLFGDAIVALLLIATIGYSAVLNRRLGVLRNDRDKLEVLVRGLTVAAQRAESRHRRSPQAPPTISAAASRRRSKRRGACATILPT